MFNYIYFKDYTLYITEFTLIKTTSLCNDKVEWDTDQNTFIEKKVDWKKKLKDMKN